MSRPGKNAYGFYLVKFFEHYLYDLGCLCWNDLADEICLDRQLAMLAASVNQDGELDAFWAAEIH